MRKTQRSRFRFFPQRSDWLTWSDDWQPECVCWRHPEVTITNVQCSKSPFSCRLVYHRRDRASSVRDSMAAVQKERVLFFQPSKWFVQSSTLFPGTCMRLPKALPGYTFTWSLWERLSVVIFDISLVFHYKCIRVFSCFTMHYAAMGSVHLCHQFHVTILMGTSLRFFTLNYGHIIILLQRFVFLQCVTVNKAKR